MSREPNPFAGLTLDVLRQRRNLKWRYFGPDVLPLWVAEMDLSWAEPIEAAVHDAVRRGDVGYSAETEYPEAFAAFAEARWQWVVDPGRIRMINDVMTGVMEVLRHLTPAGGPVIITPPVYPPFAMAVEHIGRTVVPAALDEAGRLDLSTLEEAFDRSSWRGGRPALLLASPHNPTGVVHRRDELERVAELADRYRVRVVVDEIHAGLVYPGSEFVPYLSLPGTESAVCVTSGAKSWNLQGLKAALIVPGAAAADDLASLSELVDHSVAGLGMIAHAAAFREGAAWLDEVRAGLVVNRDHLTGLLAAQLPTVGYRPPEATYLAWLDCRALELVVEPAEYFRTEAAVALGAGPDFGVPGEGFVRLNFATGPTVLEQAVHRMAGSLQ